MNSFNANKQMQTRIPRTHTQTKNTYASELN